MWPSCIKIRPSLYISLALGSLYLYIGRGNCNLVSEESLNSSLDSSEQASEAGSSKTKKKTSTGAGVV